MSLALNEFLAVIFSSVRIIALFYALPIYGSNMMPVTVKIFLATLVAVSLNPFHNPSVLQSLTMEFISIVIIKEAMVGFLMGFCIRLAYLVMTLALELGGLQMGFGMASIFDPQNQSQISVIAQVGAILSVLAFFQFNLHHEVYLGLAKSFKIVSIFEMDWNFSAAFDRIVKFLSHTFKLALKLSIPILVVMTTMNMVVGIIGRTAPQMNLFMNISFVLNICVGLTITYFVLPDFLLVLTNFIHFIINNVMGLA